MLLHPVRVPERDSHGRFARRVFERARPDRSAACALAQGGSISAGAGRHARTEAIVVARPGEPPRRPDDPEAVSQTVNEADYSRQGYLALTLPVETQVGPWHLAVFSVAIVEGHRLVSPGLEPTARTVVPGPNPEVTVAYSLRRPNLPGRSWAISFKTDPPGSAIPPTALVVHPRTVPLSPDDGAIVERFPACRDGATFPVRPRLDLARQSARLFVDPGADPTGMPPIRLRHPDSVGTRV